MATKNEKVHAAILKAIDVSGKASWKDIMDAVNATGVKVTNWLTVRGVLQWAINENQIQRINSVRVEEYERVS